MAGAVCLYLGADRAAKRAEIEALRAKSAIDPLDTHCIEADALPVKDLIALCRQSPVLSALRHITIESAHKLSRDALAALEQNRTAIEAAAQVFLCCEVDVAASHPLAKAAKAFTVKSFGLKEAPFKPFALSEAIGRCDAVGALQALSDQREQGKEVVEVLALISWQLQRWALVRKLLDKRYSPEAIAGSMQIKAWQVHRLIEEVGPRTTAQVSAWLEACLSLDAAAKSGRGLPEYDLERFVLQLCQGTKPTR
jgi:DNA polymerase III delta subunit